MNKQILSSLLFGVLIWSSSLPIVAWGQSDEVSYEGIIDELISHSKVSLDDPDPLANVMIHTGIGLTTSYLSLEPRESLTSQSGFLTGIEANLGIDLLSRAWQAEGSVRSFNREKVGTDFSVGLKEFDLKVYHSGSFQRHWRYRIGAGLAARYLNVKNLTLSGSSESHTTPASIFSAGIRAQLTQILALGGEVSLRNSLIDETIDKSAIQASLRLDAQF